MWMIEKRKTYQRRSFLKDRKVKMRKRKMLSLMIHRLTLHLVRDSTSASKMRVM